MLESEMRCEPLWSRTEGMAHGGRRLFAVGLVLRRRMTSEVSAAGSGSMSTLSPTTRWSISPLLLPDLFVTSCRGVFRRPGMAFRCYLRLRFFRVKLVPRMWPVLSRVLIEIFLLLYFL